MSILKIKIKLKAVYDNSDNLAPFWKLSEGNISHIKQSDTLTILTSENWTNAPETVTVSTIDENGFTVSANPSPISGEEVSAVFVKEYSLKDPMSLQWDIADVDSSEGSGTNQLGVTFKDRIATKRTLACGWGALSQSEMSLLLSSMTDLFFTLVFPDALKGDTDEMEVYVSGKSTPMYRMINNEQWKWTSVNVTFTER